MVCSYVLFLYIKRESQKLVQPLKYVKEAENSNKFFLHSQYSKFQLFRNMVQMLTATKPHGMKLNLSGVIPLQTKLIVSFINFNLWIYPIWFLVRKLHISNVTQSDSMTYHLILSWAFTKLRFIFIPYKEVEIPVRSAYQPL